MEQRKKNRLADYNYSQPGAYFITVCTIEHRCILSTIVGADAHIGPQDRPSIGADAYIGPNWGRNEYSERIFIHESNLPN